MNILQQLIQDALGTKKGEALEDDAQPVLNALSPLAGAVIAESPTMQAGLGIAEALGYQPPAGLASTAGSASALSSAAASILNQTALGDILAIAVKFAGYVAPGAATAPVVTVGPTLAQVSAVVVTAVRSLGLPASDDAAVEAALAAAYPAGATNLTEAEGLAALNAALVSLGLPTADDAEFVRAFGAAWTAAGYPVPT